MATEAFTAADICRMIKVGGECGVKSIVIGDLKLTFQRKTPRSPQATVDSPKNAEFSSVSLAGEQAQGPTQLDVDPGLLEDFRRGQLMIEDPLAFEQEIIDSQLNAQGG